MKKRGMVLQKRDFINPKINWDDKATNIKQMITELTLRSKDCFIY
jgi:predicted enzyme involved in methoxymalonyl-ACP biosynthesis